MKVRYKWEGEKRIWEGDTRRVWQDTEVARKEARINDQRGRWGKNGQNLVEEVKDKQTNEKGEDKGGKKQKEEKQEEGEEEKWWRIQQGYNRIQRMKRGMSMGGYRSGDMVLILVECLQGDRTSPRRGRVGIVLGGEEGKIWVKHSGGNLLLDNRQIMLMEKIRKTMVTLKNKRGRKRAKR